MTTPELKPDKYWGDKIRTWQTTCADCGNWLRLQSEHSTKSDGTPSPDPEAHGEYRCTKCGFRRLHRRMIQKTDGTPWKVTVHVDGYPNWTWKGNAPTEGKANTRAMMEYPYRLRGELVTYETLPVS